MLTTSLFLVSLMATTQFPPSDVQPPPPRPDESVNAPEAAESKPSADDFINQQIETVLKKKIVKKLPKELHASFPFRVQNRPELSPEELRAWVDSSPNRVTFAGRLPKDLEKEFDIRLLDRRAVGKRRYEMDLKVTFPLRDIAIRLDIPPGGFIFDGIDNDFDLFFTVDFEWDFVGDNDERKSLFNFLNNRDIGVFPGGTRDYVNDPESAPRPQLLRSLEVESRLDLFRLQIYGIRGRLMYQDGRFVGGQGIWRFIAGGINLGFDIAKVAKQEDNLLERIIESAMNEALYDGQPKILAMINDELLIEEVGPDKIEVRPFDILKDSLPKQAIPSILPGKTEKRPAPEKKENADPQPGQK